MNRRDMLGGLLAVASAPLWAQGAYPDRSIRLIVPFPPGGGGDALGRLVGEALAKRLGQSVVVDNKPGADQVIGTTVLVQSPADGYTLMITGDTMTAHAAYERPLPYNAFKDLTPVSRLALAPTVLVVNPSLGVKHFQELIALARAKPGQLKAGHIGSGSPQYLGLKLIEQSTGVKFLDVPYRGSGPTTLAVTSGEIDLAFAGLGASKALAEGGKVQLLAVSSRKRSPIAPNVPTIAESGLPDFDVDTAFYVYAPGATPRPVLDRLDQTLRAIMTDPAVAGRIAALGFDVDPGGHDAAVVEHRRRYEATRKLIKSLNLQWAD